MLVETGRTTGEETTSCWFELPIDVAEFEEKLGVGAESQDYRIIEKVLPYADEVHEHTSMYQLNELDFMYRQLPADMQEEYTALLTVFENLEALYICRNVITVYPDCKRAVSAGGISGGVAGAVAGSAVAGKRAERKNTASKENRGNTTSSMGQRAGSKVGAVLDTKNKVKDKANAVKENIKDMPTQTAYAVYSAKEKVKSSVSDFKRGMVQEQQSRQTGRLEKQEQHKKNIADKRMELQKAQEARQVQRKADGSATTGATRPHERPATASKPSAEKTQEVKRPATATTSKASEPVKPNVIKERPLSSGASDRKATQPAQPVHRQNVEKVVSQETRQNYKAERTTKTQTFEQSKRTTEHTEKNRNLVTKKGQKKK